MGNINREHQPHAYRQNEPKANFKQADRQSQNPYKLAARKVMRLIPNAGAAAQSVLPNSKNTNIPFV